MPLGVKVGLGPCDIVLDGDLALHTEWDIAASTFRAMSIVKRSPISVTVELLQLLVIDGNVDTDCLYS